MGKTEPRENCKCIFILIGHEAATVSIKSLLYNNTILIENIITRI